MKHLLWVALLAGCASPQYVSQQSNWDVCRLTMGGPHAKAAEAEAASRGLDCRPLYPAIQGQMHQQNQAVQQYINTTRPAPLPQQRTCTTYRAGSSLATDCF